MMSCDSQRIENDHKLRVNTDQLKLHEPVVQLSRIFVINFKLRIKVRRRPARAASGDGDGSGMAAFGVTSEPARAGELLS